MKSLIAVILFAATVFAAISARAGDAEKEFRLSEGHR